VDAIIICTGYQHHFPFLPDELRLKTNNRLWPLGLYKGVVWEKNPKLLYLGMQDQYYTFNMFDAQAWFARDVMFGKVNLPTLEEMQDDSQTYREKEESTTSASEDIDFQCGYIRDLLGLTNYPDFKPEVMAEQFKEWKHHKEEDVLTYRHHSFRSAITGTLAPPLNTPWMEQLDDRLETFLANN